MESSFFFLSEIYGIIYLQGIAQILKNQIKIKFFVAEFKINLIADSNSLNREKTNSYIGH